MMPVPIAAGRLVLSRGLWNLGFQLKYPQMTTSIFSPLILPILFKYIGSILCHSGTVFVVGVSLKIFGA